MDSSDEKIHNIRNLLSRIQAIFEIISEEGFEKDLDNEFLKSLKDLEANWQEYTKILKS